MFELFSGFGLFFLIVMGMLVFSAVKILPEWERGVEDKSMRTDTGFKRQAGEGREVTRDRVMRSRDSSATVGRGETARPGTSPSFKQLQ